MQKARVGIVGCGTISDIYLKNCVSDEFIEIVAVSDLNEQAAREKAKQYNIQRVLTPDELYTDPDVDMILNLTIPAAHAEVSLKALENGKHVFLEKPLSISLQDADQILQVAKEKGLQVGVAPDTFLGGGLQTCRQLIDEGSIGKPVAATAFMMSHGPESWHPNPYFYYQEGAGPLFDMGPYYLTALIHLIGPFRRVTGSAQSALKERIATSPERNGEVIPVNTPTHVTGVIDFENGAVGTLIMSFDVWGATLPWIEIYGTEGTLRVPDPNTFGGPVYIKKAGELDWTELALTHGNTENERGLGLKDMARAIVTGSPTRASGEMGYHVLEAMHGFYTASTNNQHYAMQSQCERPAPVETK
ncbi:Gfo/Idh/MocA family protein [Alkalicoccobacillus gibsonii]|uniref:Gfo/Idh/MocA family protein n=1 Tax=Alkalicoccobacillus gibsonii TaxID=79881 RepID=UPI003F7C98C9